MTRLYYTIFNLVALSVIIYTGVDIFYRIICSQLRKVDTKEIVMEQTPDFERRKRAFLSDFRAITDRNIFGSLEKNGEEVKAEELEALEPTSLKVALLGTVTGNERNAFAVIEETDKRKQGLYKVGDSIKNALVKRILREKVVLSVGGRDEILTMEEIVSSRSEGRRMFSKPVGTDSTITVNLEDLQSSLSDINKLLTQARVRPHFKDGEPDGLLINRIKGGSIFARLGLKYGDIAQGINGRPIKGPDDILTFYEQLKSGSQVSLQITRRGKQKTLNYSFR
jgi:general secretion pathway protein C